MFLDGNGHASGAVRCCEQAMLRPVLRTWCYVKCYVMLSLRRDPPVRCSALLQASNATAGTYMMLRNILRKGHSMGHIPLTFALLYRNVIVPGWQWPCVRCHALLRATNASAGTYVMLSKMLRNVVLATGSSSSVRCCEQAMLRPVRT